MDDIEQRIADALRAEAARVTEDSLRLPGRIERPKPRRWPALMAAAGVVATGAAVAGVVAVGGDGPEPRPMPPVLTTTQSAPATSTTSAPTTSSSLPPSSGTSSAGTTSRTTQSPPPPPQCGGKPCQVVQSVRIGPDTLEVLAAESTRFPGSLGDWKVRVKGGAVLPGASSFDRFVNANSLRCSMVAGRAVCVLYVGHPLGDSDTSLGIIKEASGWRFTGVTFPTPYGALRVDVRDVGGDRTLDVVSVESHYDVEEREFWTATLWRWDGTRLGCAPRVSTKEELPGWPNVAPDPSTVDAKNCYP